MTDRRRLGRQPHFFAHQVTPYDEFERRIQPENVVEPTGPLGRLSSGDTELHLAPAVPIEPLPPDPTLARRTKPGLSDAEREWIEASRRRSSRRFSLWDVLVGVTFAAGLLAAWKWIAHPEVFTAILGIVALGLLLGAGVVSPLRASTKVLIGTVLVIYAVCCAGLFIQASL